MSSLSLSNNLYANKIYGNKLLVNNSQENEKKFEIIYNKNIHTIVSSNQPERNGHNTVVLQFVDYDSKYHIVFDMKRFNNPQVTIAKLYITSNDNVSSCNLTHTSVRDEQYLNSFGQDGLYKYFITGSQGIFTDCKYMIIKVNNTSGERIFTFY